MFPAAQMEKAGKGFQFSYIVLHNFSNMLRSQHPTQTLMASLASTISNNAMVMQKNVEQVKKMSYSYLSVHA